MKCKYDGRRGQADIEDNKASGKEKQVKVVDKLCTTTYKFRGNSWPKFYGKGKLFSNHGFIPNKLIFSSSDRSV